MPKRSPGSQNQDDINTRFGVRLRLSREMAGRSQTEVGQALGVSFQQIQKYENGTTSISLNRLNDLASFLRLPINQFLDGLDGVQFASAGFAETGQAAYDALPTVPSLMPGPLSKDKIALLSAFSRIRSQKLRRSVVAMVEALADRADLDSEPDSESDAA